MGFIFPAALVVALDQVTKQIVWRHGQNYDFIDGYLHLTIVKNAGAAFGLFQGGRLFFIVASVVAAAFITWVGLRLPRGQARKRLYLGLILGGAIGNLIDRALFGEVIDFIRIGIAGHYWPVFNVADMGVSIGAVLLLLHITRTRHPDGQVPAPDPGPAVTAADEEGHR